jgi:hypothetical protein
MKGHNGVAARGVPQGSFQEWIRHNHMAFRLPHSGIKFGKAALSAAAATGNCLDVGPLKCAGLGLGNIEV